MARFHGRLYGRICLEDTHSTMDERAVDIESSSILSERNSTMHNRNRLKLGIFGMNLSHGLAATTVPERWDASWDHNVEAAQIADRAGVECLVPVGRWRGYGGESNFEHSSFETIAWACGLLAHTRRITVFGTVHVPLIHPVLAAKQCVTADHIGHGRFGLNIVCGWNQAEFNMFGYQQNAHDRRYAHGQEWLDIITRIWSGEGPFDYDGEFFKLSGVTGAPSPWGGRRPLIMNAGSSPAGRRFAARNSELIFDQTFFVEQAPPRIAEIKRIGRECGHEVKVFTSGYVVCRPSRKEADDYLRYFAIENADNEAVDRLIKLAVGSTDSFQPEVIEAARIRFAAGYGGPGFVGDPDGVALELKKMAGLGFDGIALGMVNFVDELPYFCQEVIPRLEALGLREPAD
ncbi:MAG: LLM class flavin-dependent oxidoreductase [Candidatus Binataceae bacterium]